MYGPADEAEAIKTIHRSVELGGNFLDTADLYGPLLNEQLIAKGETDWVFIDTNTGRPKSVPAEFMKHFSSGSGQT